MTGEFDTRPLPEIRERQLSELRDQLRYLVDASPFYRERLADVDPTDVDSLAAVEVLPFLDKETIRDEQAREPPFGRFVCADRSSIVQIHATSGTTGTPVYVGLTADDLELWKAIGRKTFGTQGYEPGETSIHALGLSKGFVGGLPTVQRLQALGVGVAPVGAEAGAERLLRSIDDLEPESFVALPSFARYLGRKAESVLGIPASALPVERITCGGEPLGELRGEIERIWGADVFEIMGASEVAPGFLAECEHRTGLHVAALEHFLPELVDPETDEPLEWTEGTTGELVMTTLGREASPVLRYRLGDIVTVVETACPCGRSWPTIHHEGRVDNMLVVRGVNVFPSTVQDVIHEFSTACTGHFRIVKDFEGHSTEDPLEIKVEYADDHADRREELREELAGTLRSRLGHAVEIRLVESGTFERPDEGKVSLIEDTGS
jgi:phenylacetate-CoA ligase